MNLEMTKMKDKRYLKLKNLARRQNEVLNNLLQKHTSMLSEKDKIIEEQYNIIQNQSRNIECLLYELEKSHTKKTVFQKLKSVVRIQEPALSM